MAAQITQQEYNALIQTVTQFQASLTDVTAKYVELQNRRDKKEYDMPLKDFSPEVYDGTRPIEFTDWDENVVLYLTKTDNDSMTKVLDMYSKQEEHVDPTNREAAANQCGTTLEKVTAFDRLLYKCLKMKTAVGSGARKVVKNGEVNDGLNAWRRLCQEYDPRLITGAQAHLERALQIPRAKNHGDIGPKLRELEEHIRQYERYPGKKFDDDLKIQRLYDIVPMDAKKQLLLERKGNESVNFQAMLSRIHMWVKLADKGPAPMDTSACLLPEQPAAENQETEEAWASNDYDWPTPATANELYGMQSGKNKGGKGFQGNCHKCGGYGHMARDCPIDKGKGKGQMNKGGKNRNGGKSWSKGKGSWKGNEGWQQKGWKQGKGKDRWSPGSGKGAYSVD